MLDVLGDGLGESTRLAWREAENITILVLREMLSDLASTWMRFAKYFHAFKHGGLVANRPDYTVLDEEGEPRDAAIAVWLRRQSQPAVHGDATATDITEVVSELELLPPVGPHPDAPTLDRYLGLSSPPCCRKSSSVRQPIGLVERFGKLASGLAWLALICPRNAGQQ